MGQLNNIFNTKEFKELSWKKRFIIRLKVAFFDTIKMF
jgi:hypothetical protein